MCSIVLVDGEEVSEVGDLSRKLGIAPVMIDGEKPDKDGECLCGCNIETMAEQAGAKIKQVSSDDELWGIYDYRIQTRR